MVDWDEFLQKLRSFPPHVHNLRPPCPLERVEEEGLRMGKMPCDLVRMLKRFNGGELFLDALPFITLFGLSMPDDPTMLGWFVDRFTSAWRSHLGASTDWVIGITNYGGVMILNEVSFVQEWDSSQQTWMDDPCPFNEWVEKILTEGTAYLDEGET